VAKPKTCKICKDKFIPVRQLQPTCNKMECMIAYSNKHLAKKKLEVKKTHRQALKKFNNSDINILKRLAQKIFNQYIRKRDEKLLCISCGYNFNTAEKPRQAHASHYRPATNSNLRFDERNVWRSCQICNTHLSGNLANYRIALIDKIGLEQVEELEATNGIKKFTTDELQEIINKYRGKLKEL